MFMLCEGSQMVQMSCQNPVSGTLKHEIIMANALTDWGRLEHKNVWCFVAIFLPLG